MIRPQVLLLKEGTGTSQGKSHLIANINACAAVADILRTTLGPMGMDKLIKTADTVNISNDGATILRLLDLVHPAAKTLVEISQSQDKEIGDGTTSVVLLASELLQNAKEFIEDGVTPQAIIAGYRAASAEALKHLEAISFKVTDIDLPDGGGDSKERFMLRQCAKTALNSKLIENEKDFFASMLVDAYLSSAEHGAPREFVHVKPIAGGSVRESFLVQGVAFKKTFSYAGFEQQPKSFENPLIALLNVELELKTEHLSGEVRVGPDKYKSIVDAEWKILYDKLDIIVDSKANIVLSKLPIGDLATQYFASKSIFCAGRVPEEDLSLLAAFSGGSIQTSLENFEPAKVLGKCQQFEERQIGKERVNVFTGGLKPKAPQKTTIVNTLVLRGGSEQYIEEASRSINDAAMIIKNAANAQELVSGGGAVEMELSRRVKQFSTTLSDTRAFLAVSFAKSLEVIPKTLAKNAGMDTTDTLNELRSRHYHGEERAGVDVMNETISDLHDKFVWEPLISKRNMIESAAEAACLILSVDETVRAPKNDGSVAPGGRMPQGGMGMPMGGMGMPGMAQ